MILPEDVPMWLVLSGVGHALEFTQNGWGLTACGTYTPCGGGKTDNLPRRICSKCRKRLVYARRIERDDKVLTP